MIIDANYGFCQTCEHHGKFLPETELFCARTTHDKISMIAGSIPEELRDELDTRSDTSITEKQFSFDVEMMDAIAVCVQSRKNGGLPLAVE